jgi:signal transduction histidine kinase
MVESFLSVERLSAGELELHRIPVLPREILAACIERSAHLAARKQIEIELGECSDEPIWGDREFLEYACYNLLSNAIKYSPAKTSITVRARHEGDSVRISVEDHGYGMDERELKNIFHKFYRTRRAQESGEAGTGLGLAIVEEIVVQHGGAVEVESVLNRGSRFTLSLPRATRRAMQAVAETQP